ncbi:hypothetical protein [Flavimarina sp. Hel_I_48]|uniref:hypothetical protein n=1 Tax=Flavimarina sp. Hel_I_48 TaxID=1392488 RepID=UPI0004DF6991|nr:hypothetical protein [Flavimarina sp. Hel_I_48]
MEIDYAHQIDFEDLTSINFDIVIIAKNHEARWDYLVNSLSKSLKLGNSRNIILSYDQNDNFKKKHFEVYSPHSDNIKDLIKILENEFSKVNKKEIKVLVDYSCMTKTWYYTIMLFIKQRNLNFEEISVFFSYTPSQFSKPKKPKHNLKIEPLPGKYRIPNDKPKALIVCLGYEEKKAEGIIDYLDPKETIIIYSKPAIDENFVEQIESSNKSLISKFKSVNTFDMSNLKSIEEILQSLFLTLNKDFSVIIAPLGPKPFTFVAMLLSLKYENIDIWRVSSGSNINIYKRKPIENTFIISKVVFN